MKTHYYIKYLQSVNGGNPTTELKPIRKRQFLNLLRRYVNNVYLEIGYAQNIKNPKKFRLMVTLSYKRGLGFTKSQLQGE